MDSRLYNVLTFVICIYIINVEVAKRKKSTFESFFLKDSYRYPLLLFHGHQTGNSNKHMVQTQL